jgi:acetoin utilization deacetylase AcuC-like enzyme
VPHGPLFAHFASSWAHDTGPGHPERAERITALAAALEEHDAFGYALHESPLATDAQLTAVHPPEYVAAIERFCAAGGGAIDADTVVSARSCEAARHAAGGVVALVDALLAAGGPRVGGSLHRPPGHHAERARAMGFCVFNSVAVGARWALDHHGLERVLVLDWDVHHGNGTNAIFRAEPRVLFVSVHQSPLYPGTGPATDVGTGPGRGTSVNVPVPGGSGDETFCSVVEHLTAPLAREWRPQLLLVSAGFDAHRDDPLAGCAVSDAGYAAMASALRRVADELGAPLGIVLEGGYELGALTRGLGATLEAIAAEPGGPREELAPHPLALEALERTLGLLGLRPR